MKNVVLFITLLCVSIIGFSQTETKIENSKVRFGFNLAANYSILKYVELVPTNSEVVNGFGFQVGLLMDYSISKNFLISPKLEVSFNGASVEFFNSATPTYHVMPESANSMIHFVFKMGNNQMQPYILVGPNFKLPLQNKTKLGTELSTNPDIAIDFGIGLDYSFQYFICAPEIRYSYGLRDVNRNPNLPALNMHSIALVLNFK